MGGRERVFLAIMFVPPAPHRVMGIKGVPNPINDE